MKIKTLLFTAVFVALSSFSAFAAELTMKHTITHGVHMWQTMDAVTKNDTVACLFWPGGEGIFYISGTQGGAVFDLKYDPANADCSNAQTIDTDNAPDGLAFNSTSGILAIPSFSLSPGYLMPVFSSAGDISSSLTFTIKENKTVIRN